MIITITVDDDKVLEAIHHQWKKAGRPDTLDDASYIDSQDIAQWLIPYLELDDKDIEIDRS